MLSELALKQQMAAALQAANDQISLHKSLVARYHQAPAADRDALIARMKQSERDWHQSMAQYRQIRQAYEQC